MYAFQLHGDDDCRIGYETQSSEIFAREVQFRRFAQVGYGRVERRTLRDHRNLEAFGHIARFFATAIKSSHCQVDTMSSHPAERLV